MLASELESSFPASLGLRLRPETNADVSFLQQLYAETRLEELAPVAWTEQQKGQFLLGQFNLQRRHYREHYSDAEFLIIEQDNRRIGRLYLCPIPGEIRVMDIILVAASRGAGLGTSIMGCIIELARSRDRAVTLHVEANNPVLRLYRRLHFEVEDERGPYLFMRRPRSIDDVDDQANTAS